MSNENVVRTVDMGLVSTDSTGGMFVLEMHAKHNAARSVKFSIDQIDARTLLTALESYLKSK